jgi:hypothetical protein
MLQIIEEIQKIFTEFEGCEFEIDYKNKKIADIDLDEIAHSIHIKIPEVKKELQKIYLLGGNINLSRIRLELLEIKKGLLLSSRDFTISVHCKSEPHDFIVDIESELINRIGETKIPYITELINYVEKLLLLPKTKTDKIKAPVLALFCYLINESGISNKKETESVENYCTRICEKYKLPYSDRVRQNFNGSNIRKYRTEITERILPTLDSATKEKILKHLNSKTPPKQNMYA